MRVALVHPFSWPEVRRGGERYLHDLAWYLCSRGHDVDVIVGGGPSVEAVDGVRLVRLRHPRRLDHAGLTREDTFGLPVLGWMARHRYDVVHALTPTAALAAVASRHRTVYTALGHPTSASISRRRLDAQLFRRTVRRVAAPLALSRSAADAVAAVTGIRPQVLAPGVRTAGFPLDDRPRTGPARVLFPAYADDPRKGLDALLASFVLVLDRYPGARLLLGGGGSPGWALQRLEADVRARIEPALDDLGTGDLADMPARYADATVTVLPSINEAFGLVLVESLAAGTPVVAVAGSGPDEIVTAATVGRLAPSRDPGPLAAAIVAAIALAGDPATPSRCADHARRWDWATAVGPRHEEIYRRVVRR